MRQRARSRRQRQRRHLHHWKYVIKKGSVSDRLFKMQSLDPSPPPPKVAKPSEADSAARIERLKREGEATLAKRMQRLVEYEAMLTKQLADIDASGAAPERVGDDEPENDLMLDNAFAEEDADADECILDADGNCMDTALGQLLPTASADAALAQLLTESAAAPKSQGTRKVEKKVVTAPVAVAEKEVAPAAAATKAGGLTLSQQAELAHVRHMIAGLTLSLESYKVAEKQILALGEL